MKKILFLFLFPIAVSFSQISISAEGNVSVIENFNSLGTTAAAILPANWKADKISKVRTTGTYTAAGNTVNYIGGDNSSNAISGNGIYNFGLGAPASATDRALGGISSGSGSQSVNIYAYFKNTGSLTITQVDLSYDVMRFRNGTNAAGFSIMLYYSTDGATWSPAGTSFANSFAPNSDILGAAVVPLETQNVRNQTLSGLSIPQNGTLYLAWNYSVTSGTVTTNAQALGIDNFSMNNILPGGVTSIPAPPVAVAATNLTKNGFTANWNSSVGAAKYYLDVSTQADFSSFVTSYNDMDVGNSISRSVSSLTPGTQYYYRVRAFNTVGTSGNSNSISVTTPAVITYVQFNGICDAVAKMAGTYSLPVSITDADNTTATTCSVTFIPDSSTATAAYLNNYSTSVVTFPAGSSVTQNVIFTVVNDGISELPKKAVFQIKNVNGGTAAHMGTPAQFRLTITSGINNAYYSSLPAGLTGSELKAAIHSLLIKDIVKYPYTDNSSPAAIDVWKMDKAADEDPKNYNNIIGIYSGLSIPKDPESSWNREHVWSKSHGDFGTTNGAGTDGHHLRPENPSVNTLKGNLDFDNGGSLVPGTTNCNYDSDSWEPRDEVKGDVARMIFYMAVRYQGDNGEPNLQVVDYIPSSPNDEPLYGKLSTLLKWNDQDPVDAFEMNRNNVIAYYQHDRNPFIDHPEWVKAIWGTPSAVQNKEAVPDSYALLQNYPNPFNPSTTIKYSIPDGETTRRVVSTLKVYDILGREVATLVNEEKSSGNYEVKFDGSRLGSGVYFYTLRAGDFVQTKKMMLIK